ncbi:Bcr/CflA family efflux MFS transporter [Stackebrandtia albiflava]|uniref:Bcr/CflA family efflux MFS transporter n=1 Tax=Stackebrandtia albiflava TaxID=406432 RepID=UPI0011BE7544
MPRNPTGALRTLLAIVLAAAAMLGPLNVDMYLPAFPEMTEDLSGTASQTQLSLTSCLIGMAIGQFVIGPISDARGRRGPLTWFTALFALSSLACAVSPSMELLITARFLQGFTAAAGVVLSRAVARDVFDGRELTRFFALLMVINAGAPMVAPVLGGALLALPFGAWPLIFVFLGLIGVGLVLLVRWRLPETLPPQRRIRGSARVVAATAVEVLTDRAFLGYALTVGVVHGGSFAYVAGTPFVYQEIYGVSPQVFGVLFGVNGLAIIAGSWAVGRLSARVAERVLLRYAVITAVAATAVLLVAAVVRAPLALVVTAIFGYMVAVGMILTGSFTLAMAEQAHRAGSAGAVLGALPLIIGAIVSPLVGLDESSALPMAAVLFGSSVLGGVAFAALTGPRRR